MSYARRSLREDKNIQRSRFVWPVSGLGRTFRNESHGRVGEKRMDRL